MTKLMKSKSGITLVEVVVAVALLALTVVAAITALNLTQTTIARANAQEKSAALAQGAVDTLMSAVSGCSFDATDTVVFDACALELPGANPVTAFSDIENGVQYQIKKETGALTAGGEKTTTVYHITARAYYNSISTTYTATAYPLGGLQHED